jgi:hypothetical protein
MNSNKAFGAALLAMLISGTAVPATETAVRGPFEGVAATDTMVWVVDTRTGQVRKCTQEFADQTPRCTPMSN